MTLEVLWETGVGEEEGGTRNQTERTTLDLFLKSIYIFHLHACLLHVYLTTGEEVHTIYYIPYKYIYIYI